MAAGALPVGLAVIEAHAVPGRRADMAGLAAAGDTGMGAVVRLQCQMTIGTLTVGLAVIEGDIQPVRRVRMTRLTVTGDTGMGGVVGFQR